jgi:hypothetical protein
VSIDYDVICRACRRPCWKLGAAAATSAPHCVCAEEAVIVNVGIITTTLPLACTLRLAWRGRCGSMRSEEAIIVGR